MTGRLPASVTFSLGLHAGALFLFLGMAKEAPRQAQRIVEGVDLLIQAPKPRAAAAPAPLSTMDFLKMALPTVRTAAPASLQVKIPERKIALAEAPKLEDRAKHDLGPKLAALDLNRQRVEAAKVEAKLENRRQAAATLAALPRLEDVGRRKVKNLPEAVALEERRREVSAAGLSQLEVKSVTRRQAAAAMATLQEAAPPEAARPAARKGLASLLPEERFELKPQAAPAAAPPRLEKIAEQPRLARRQAEASMQESKKGVEIEGPLADRKVSAYDIPAFPVWARTQGILEAAVAIRFTVNAEGAVMPGMRVERTSGYGRLDKLAMESLSHWRFEPLLGSGVQWGVITFRFVLE